MRGMREYSTNPSVMPDSFGEAIIGFIVTIAVIFIVYKFLQAIDNEKNPSSPLYDPNKK